MAFAPRSPHSRKSLSLSEHNLNVDYNNVTLPVTNKKFRVKRQSVALADAQAPSALHLNTGFNEADEPSPRTRARRSKPRKSILKAFASATASQANEDTTDYTFTQYANTIAFPPSTDYERSSEHSSRQMQNLARRVSFAPNAHVRMFEPPKDQPKPRLSTAVAISGALLPTSMSLSRDSASASQRSSALNLTAVNHPASPGLFVPDGTAEGEASMDLDTASEASSSDDEGVEMGRQRTASYPAGDHTVIENDEQDADGEEEMDMDITQVVYGGIVRRQSVANPGNVSQASDMDTEGNDSAITAEGDAEEKTMDFTIAIGGLIPHSPPVGASNTRASIGYSFKGAGQNRIMPGTAMEGELDMDMDETVAIGGIIGANDSLSTASGEDTMNGSAVGRERTMTFSFGNIAQVNHADDMEMTMAVGGIVSFSQSPRAVAPPTPANNRPIAGTPSFARPTVSSVHKSRDLTQKRNIFAPSPSPVKSTTPKKTGMDAAADVAKRLSFGSTTSSGGGGRKRAREEAGDEEQTSSAKKARPTLSGGSVFDAPDQINARHDGTPLRNHPLVQADTATSRSPARSPFRRAMAQTLNVEEADDVQEAEWEEPPTISLAAFLEMAGVQFMEGLPGLNRRRSSVARGLLGHSTYGSNDREFGLHEYAEAQIQSVFLNMYTWATDSMKADIQRGQTELVATETDCSLNNPPVIQEYLSASDDDKQLFEMTFKTFKTNTQLKAREKWYDWKMELVERCRPDVEGLLEGMREDNERLGDMTEQATTLLPELRVRYEAVQAELQMEREAVANLAQNDPEELREYRAAMDEQGTQIAGFTSELNDVTVKLFDLQSKLDELNARKSETVVAINTARSKCDQFTKSDVIKLREEYGSLQHLHLWRIVSLQPNLFELSFDDEIVLSFPCSDHTPILSSGSVSLLVLDDGGGGKWSKGNSTEAIFPIFNSCFSSLIKRKPTSLSRLVQQTGQLWSAAERLRSELGVTAFRHPLRFAIPDADGLIVTATMMIPSQKSKVELDWCITEDTLKGWPESISGVEVRARVIYGEADEEVLTEAAKATIELARPEGYQGAWLSCCVEAVGKYLL